MHPHARLARIAGLLYLTVVVCGVFAHLVVRARVYVAGDAAATAANVAADPALLRMGFAADLVMATAFLLLGMALYRLLRHVNEDVARAMVVFVALSVAIICMNLLNHLGALIVSGDGAYATALGPEGSDALVLLMFDMHRHGYLIAQLFFGLWLAPLGYLVYRSGMFPRLLGVLLVVGAASHLIDMFGLFLVPDIAETVAPFVTAPAVVAEFGMLLWLLIRGAGAPRSQASAPVAV